MILTLAAPFVTKLPAEEECSVTIESAAITRDEVLTGLNHLPYDVYASAVQSYTAQENG